MSNETLVAERPKEHRERRKQNRGRKVAPNQALAVAKFIRVPPRKARLVMDEVRGKYAVDALNFLRFIPNRAAGYISKALASAVANAVNNHGLTPDNLKLVEARIDEGPRMKRMQPRAQGRAYRILKRMSHITVIVEDAGPRPQKPRKPVGSRAAAARAARQAASAPAAVPAAAAAAPADSLVEETVTDETTAAADTTDEIGAPVENAAPATATEETTAEASATTESTQAPESASDDATDEIGAPTDTADAKTQE
jgi:large subunit ribosomal protein L22